MAEKLLGRNGIFTLLDLGFGKRYGNPQRYAMFRGDDHVIASFLAFLWYKYRIPKEHQLSIHRKSGKLRGEENWILTYHSSTVSM